MNGLLKKITPSFVLIWYHFCLAFFGALIYGFPSRKLIVIGVTGTKGKTTTCNLIAQILQGAGFKTGMATTVNFRIGEREWLNEYKQTMLGRFKLQKLLRQMVREGCRYAVIETSSEGILQHRHRGIDYSVAVFTNLSPEHIERHGSFEKYREAKMKLFEVVARKKDGVGVYNLDDDNVGFFLEVPIAKRLGYFLNPPPARLASQPACQAERGGQGESVAGRHPSLIEPLAQRANQAFTKEGDSSLLQREGRRDFEKFQISNKKLNANKTEFDFYGERFEMPLIGEFNVYNACAAICVGLSQGINLAKIGEILRNAKPAPGRLEIINEGQPFTVVVDYAHEPASLEAVYKAIKIFNPRKIIALLGAQGGGRDKQKRPLLGQLADKYTDYIIITNEDPYDEPPRQIIEDVAAGVKNREAFKIIDRREAIKKALNLAEDGDAVVLTGKGGEVWMCVESGKRILWQESEIVREELKKIFQK